MKSRAEIESAVREVLSGALRRKVRDEETLVSSGLIDSLMILRLISQLEAKLGSQIATENIQPDDFDTVPLAIETVERTIVQA
jgi:acyl carrier protein